MIGSKKPTLPGLTMPEVTVPAVTRPAFAVQHAAAAPAVPPTAPDPVAVAQAAITAPSPGRSLAPWIIAGASFVIVLAVAGGFVIAKIFGSSETASHGGVKVAASAETSKATPPQAAPVTPTVEAPPATSPATIRPPASIPAAPHQPARAATSPPPVAASATVAAPQQNYAVPSDAKDPFRAAMDSLEGGGWRYLDDTGAITAGADAAEPLFRAALDEEPGHASAQLHLAVTALFRRRYVVAQKALFPLLTNDTLPFEERTIASFAYSASAVAPSGTGLKEFEASLDQSLAYYGNNPQFAAFARDVRWLVRRKTRS
jgi:hypothetical protein